MSHLVTKPTKWQCAQRRLRSVWASAQSDQSLHCCAQWVAKDPSFLHADSKDSDHTGWMPSLIQVFTRRTGHFVGFIIRRQAHEKGVLIILVNSKGSGKLMHPRSLARAIAVPSFKPCHEKTCLCHMRNIDRTSVKLMSHLQKLTKLTKWKSDKD